MTAKFKAHDVIAHTPPHGITDLHLQVLATYKSLAGYWHAVRVLKESPVKVTVGDQIAINDDGPEYSLVRHETKVIR
jgi:hypothetical protein